MTSRQATTDTLSTQRRGHDVCRLLVRIHCGEPTLHSKQQQLCYVINFAAQSAGWLQRTYCRYHFDSLRHRFHLGYLRPSVQQDRWYLGHRKGYNGAICQSYHAAIIQALAFVSADENRFRDQHSPFATSIGDHLEGCRGTRYRWFLSEFQIGLIRLRYNLS